MRGIRGLPLQGVGKPHFPEPGQPILLVNLDFGVVYLLLGIAGFVAGTGDDRMLTIIAGQLELGTMDHVVHVVFGVIFLLGGLMTKASPTLPLPPPRR